MRHLCVVTLVPVCSHRQLLQMKCSNEPVGVLRRVIGVCVHPIQAISGHHKLFGLSHCVTVCEAFAFSVAIASLIGSGFSTSL